MTAAERARVAVVDLGTNTTRLLIGDVQGAAVTEVERVTEITRLGEGLDAGGSLAEPAKRRVLDALTEFSALIDRHSVDRVVGVATSAMRDATDGEEFRAEIARRHRIDARTISGAEEARLTFLGATGARTSDPRHTLVIDIGGGSTELVIGRPGQTPEVDVSARAGSVRQTERHLHDDPPSPDSLQALAAEVRSILAEEVASDLRAGVEAGIAVAGTATSLAAISQNLEPYDPDLVHGFVLELGEAERLLAMLAALPLEERRHVSGLHPDRAPTIVAGAVILVESLRAFELERVEISEADLLHGAAMEAVR